MGLESKHIHLVAFHGTAGTAHPSIGGIGTNIAQATWSSAGFETMGSQQLDSCDHDLDAEALDLVLASVLSPIRAPRSGAPDDHRYEGGTLEPFALQAFGMPEALIALSSNMTVGSNIAQPSTSTTKRTVVIELNGYGLLYMPQVELMLTGLPMGYLGEDSAKAVFTVNIETDNTYKFGWHFTYRV